MFCWYTLSPEACAVIFLEGLIYAVAVAGACRIIFYAVERLQFLTREKLLFFDLQFFLLCEIRPKAAEAQIT